MNAKERGVEVAKLCRNKPLTATQISRIVELLNDGADLNVRYGPGNTALHYAAEKGHSAIVQELLLKGADRLDLNDNHKSPIDLARSAGHIGVTKILEAFTSHKPSQQAALMEAMSNTTAQSISQLSANQQTLNATVQAMSNTTAQSIPVPNSPQDGLVVEEAASTCSDSPLMPVPESACFETESTSQHQFLSPAEHDACKDNVTITTIMHQALQDNASNAPAEQLACQDNATSIPTFPPSLGRNKVYPEVITLPKKKSDASPRYKVHAEAYSAPNVNSVDSSCRKAELQSFLGSLYLL